MKLFDKIKEKWEARRFASAVAKTMKAFEASDAFRKKASKKERRTVYALKPGASWNPLVRFPRNQPCFCGSAFKSKFCCLPFVARALPTSEVTAIKKVWSQILDGRVQLPAAPQSARARKAA